MGKKDNDIENNEIDLNAFFDGLDNEDDNDLDDMEKTKNIIKEENDNDLDDLLNSLEEEDDKDEDNNEEEDNEDENNNDNNNKDEDENEDEDEDENEDEDEDEDNNEESNDLDNLLSSLEEDEDEDSDEDEDDEDNDEDEDDEDSDEDEDDDDDEDDEEDKNNNIKKNIGNENPIDIKKFNSNINKTKNNIVLMRDGEKYTNFEALFNGTNKEKGNKFSMKLLEKSEYEKIKLEDFKSSNLKIKKLPYTNVLSGINWKDDKDRITDDEIGTFMAKVLGMDPNEIKQSFSWGNKFFSLYKKFLNSNDFFNIIKRLINSGDKETILVGYDMLKNKYLFSDIETLRHYLVIGTTGSGKTVTLIEIVFQYLLKGNTKVMFLEKGTDLDGMFRICDDLIYKCDVESISYTSIVAIFTYFSLELQRRKNELAKFKTKKIQDYNKIMKKKGNKEMDYVLFVVDEFARLRNVLGNISKEADKFFVTQLAGLLAVARSYGLYFIFATQSPNAETGVPTIIQNNISSYITGKTSSASSIKYLESSDERYIANKGKVVGGDFLIKSEGIKSTIMRSFFVGNNHVQEFIDEGYIKERPKEQQNEIHDINDYSDGLLNIEIQKLVKKIGGLDLLFTEKFNKYGINEESLNAIIGIKKISTIVMINLLLNWFESEVCKKIRETNMIPVNFNMENSIKRTLDNQDYKALSFIFLLIEDDYNKYLDAKIKTIKISKSSIKAGKDDDIQEVRENFLGSIEENITYNVNEMLEILKNT